MYMYCRNLVKISNTNRRFTYNSLVCAPKGVFSTANAVTDGEKALIIPVNAPRAPRLPTKANRTGLFDSKVNSANLAVLNILANDYREYFEGICDLFLTK